VDAPPVFKGMLKEGSAGNDPSRLKKYVSAPLLAAYRMVGGIRPRST